MFYALRFEKKKEKKKRKQVIRHPCQFIGQIDSNNIVLDS